MSEKLYRAMSDDVKQLYCIESVDGEWFSIEEVVDLLNKKQHIINRDRISLNTMISNMEKLEEENKRLRKQIQNYEKLLANSYVGEEERLDGFFGKYEIWEDELQEYKNKKMR